MVMASKPMKREREDEAVEIVSPSATSQPSEDATAGAAGNSTTNFRNVSACNRCRTRKNRCDQKLPRCTGCEKVGVKCVGFDPVSKRTIPRSYVYYLETRTRRLEEILDAHGISFPSPEDDFSISDAIRPGINVPFPVEDGGGYPLQSPGDDQKLGLDPALGHQAGNTDTKKLASDVGMVSLQNSPRRTPGAPVAGISFAKVVFAAVRSTVTNTPSERGGARSAKQLGSDSAGGTSSARDSFFGLHTRPTVKPAPFPERDIGRRLVDLYFEYANPQIPILHRGEFMSLFDRVYGADPKRRTPRELYSMNIVFAIGSGIIMDSSSAERAEQADGNTDPPKKKRAKLTDQSQPEEYHSAAVMHLESFLGSSPTADSGGGGLEELQAVCLLAGLALLRPVAPGLWYIIGVAVRLAVDLGLHSEEIDQEADSSQDDSSSSKNFGRRQWTKDLRRRLWWCVYSLDRLVSTCVGRPFGITDQVVTTEFPSLLDDRHITTSGFLKESNENVFPTYKLVAHHYFRLRLLQSEILQVLQHRQAEQARSRGANYGNSYIHKDLISPFMGKFASFQDWRIDVDRRLWEWKENSPHQKDIGVAFTPLFLELNYWQAVIMLYRQSLAVPEQLADLTGASASGDVQSPGTVNERREDEEMVLMKVAQAGQTVLKLYRQLHRLKLVNYTYLATHHLFMSGISFLYAIWHSPLVRSQLTLEDVDITVLIATSVLGDLISKCPPAEACRDALARMSKATIAMVENSTGFGSASTLSSQPLNVPRGNYLGNGDTAVTEQSQRPAYQTDLPHFDMDLKALFSEEEIASRPLAQQFKLHTAAHRRAQQAPSASRKKATPSEAPQRAQQSSHFRPDHTTPIQQSPTTASLSTTTSSYQPTQQQPQFANSPPLTLTLSNQTPYAPLAQTISQSQPDFVFDADMSFLDTFPISDPSGQSGWGGGWEGFDMSFATGGTGTGWEDGGDWNGFGGAGGMGGGVDMFDGFFFGGEGNGGGFG